MARIHHIVTGAHFDNEHAYEAVLKICLEVEKSHGCVIGRDEHQGNIRLTTNANGAALRDLVTALDQAGYLD